MGTPWREGLDQCIDDCHQAGEQMEAAGEEPTVLCAFMLGNRGTLTYCTAGSGSPGMTDLVLSELTLQLSDLLLERAKKDISPEVVELLNQLEEVKDQEGK